MRFLLESLEDLNGTFGKFGGGLRLFRGDPVEIFKEIHSTVGIRRICFEQVPFDYLCFMCNQLSFEYVLIQIQCLYL
jgi:hypothetical protein